MKQVQTCFLGLALATFSSCTQAFLAPLAVSPSSLPSWSAPATGRGGGQGRVRGRGMQTMVVPMEHLATVDVHQVHSIAQHTMQSFDPAWLSHALQGIADAAAPAIDAAAPVVEEAKEPGWWDSFVLLVENSIKSLNSGLKGLGIEQSFGLSIVLFTSGLKLALLPITYRQLESAQRMQALTPKAKELKEKYGKNKALLNQLTAKLYQDADVNPLAGCLPAIAQIPIFIALYRSLLNLATSDADLNEPFLWLPSLAGPLYGQQRGTAWLTQNWIDGHPSLGWHDTIAFLTIPVILIITQSISMKLLSPPPADNDPKAAQTQAILKYLPFMVGYFSLSVPSGLGIYWITNNLVSTSISLAIKEKFKRNPITFDEVDVNPDDLGVDPASVPMAYEEMLEEARANYRPNRESKRRRMMVNRQGHLLAGHTSASEATSSKPARALEEEKAQV